MNLSALISNFQPKPYVNRLDYNVEAETDLKTMENSVLEMVIRKNCKNCENGFSFVIFSATLANTIIAILPVVVCKFE